MQNLINYTLTAFALATAFSISLRKILDALTAVTEL
jgi:hypothetical protein